MITNARNIPNDFKKCGIDKSYDEIFALICKNMQFEVSEKRFVYFIDANYVMDTTKGYRYENLTPAYDKVLASGLEQLKYPSEDVTNRFCKSYNLVLENMCLQGII